MPKALPKPRNFVFSVRQVAEAFGVKPAKIMALIKENPKILGAFMVGGESNRGRVNSPSWRIPETGLRRYLHIGPDGPLPGDLESIAKARQAKSETQPAPAPEPVAQAE